MMEIFLVKQSSTVDVTSLIETVEWGGSKTKAPREIRLNLVHTNRGLHQSVPMSEGEGIIFRWNKVELFRGIIFGSDLNKSARRSLLVYDLLIYMARNKDIYLFTKKRADEIFKKLCGDFGIPVGTVANTGYVIPYRLYDGDSLWDMNITALNLTKKQTGQKFKIIAKEGKAHLVKMSEQLRKWVIESGVNLVDYSFSSSIEETVTKVKLRAGEEKKTIIATAQNDSLMKQFGVLQYYESVGEKLTKAELDARAKAILDKQGKVNYKFQLTDILGIPDVTTGSAVYVIVPDLGIKKAYYVEEDKHTFKGQNHRMSLTLVETNDIPEIDAGTGTDGSKAKKASGKKTQEQEDKEFAEKLRKEILG